MSDIDEKYKRIEDLSSRSEELDAEITVAQKKAILKELKKTYGTNWRGIVGSLKNLIKLSPEAIEALYGIKVPPKKG